MAQHQWQFVKAGWTVDYPDFSGVLTRDPAYDNGDIILTIGDRSIRLGNTAGWIGATPPIDPLVVCDLAGCPRPVGPGLTIVARVPDPLDGLLREVTLSVCAEHHRACQPENLSGFSI